MTSAPPGTNTLAYPDLHPRGLEVEGSALLSEPTWISHAPLNLNSRHLKLARLRLNDNHPVTLVLVYRPPPSRQNGLTMTQFLQEWDQFLSHVCTTIPSQLCILGDINMHYDEPDMSNIKQMKNIASGLDLKQHINVPTHVAGHTLDLVFTRDDPMYSLVKSISVVDIGISDHFAVTCHLHTYPLHLANKIRIARPLKSIPVDILAQQLGVSLSSIKEGINVNDLLSDFDSRAKEVLDNIAPLRTITIKGDSLKPWYNDSIHEARQRRRQLERKATRSGLEVHRQMLAEQTRTVVHMINSSKSSFYQEKLTTADSKETFRIISSLVN